jgi:hypothetical protein
MPPAKPIQINRRATHRRIEPNRSQHDDGISDGCAADRYRATLDASQKDA